MPDNPIKWKIIYDAVKVFIAEDYKEVSDEEEV
jgi:hypothetical protein